MDNRASIKAVITADDRASNALKHFGNSVESVGHKVAKIAKIAAIGVAAAGAAAVAFGVAAVKAYSEAEDGIEQTRAVIKSTGGAAGVTAKQVTELSQALQKVTKFSDEEVRSAQNMLLTFTSIGKDVFPQATKTVLNMSTALGQDLKSSSIQLGKALQDPIRGITALRRVGVNFTDAQKDVIQGLVDTGKTAEAQRLILKELEVEFGGSAEAAGKTFSGSLARLKNNLNDVQETIGFVIVDAIQPFTQAIANAVNAIDWEEVIDNTIFVLKNLWHNYIVPITQAVVDLATRFYNFLNPSLSALFRTIQSNLIPALNQLWKNIIEPLIPVIGVAFAAAVWAAINALNVIIKVVSSLTSFLSQHRVVVLAVVAAFTAWYATMKIAAGFNALYNFIALANARLFTLTAQAGGARGALSLLNRSMSTFGGFGILAGAAVLAAAAIIDAANRTKAAWDAAMRSVQSASSSDDAVIRQLRQLQKTGTAEQKARATKTLQGLAAGGAFASGGFTGQGSPSEIAGVVHKGEYVLPPNMVDQNRGLPKMAVPNINVSVNVGVYAGSEVEKRKLAAELYRALQDVASSKSMTVAQMLGG